MRGSLKAFCVGALVACSAPAPAPKGPPTYLGDVAPLIAARCSECHHAGGVAPSPSLADYEDVKSYADPISMDAQLRTMPPWGADDSGACGTWDGARWLTDDEIATFVTWEKNGEPEGAPDTITGATPPLPIPFVTDAVLDLGGVYQPGLGAGGNRCFVADPALDRDRLLTAISVSSGDARAVAQVTLFALDSDAAESAAASLDAGDPGLGYSCFGTSRTPDSRLVASWSWPTPELPLPSGTGVRLLAGRKLIVQIHYDIAATGSAFASDTQVALQLDDTAREAFVVTVAASGPLAPGLESVTADFEQPAGQRMTLVGVAPRMHIRGKSMTLAAERSGGTICLASFPNWNFYESQLFRAQSPVPIDASDVLHVSCTFGTLGRTDPVPFGDSIDDEECTAYLFVTP